MLPTTSDLVFTDILTSLATHQPFMNVSFSHPEGWFFISAIKSYYNSSRLNKKSLPDRVVIPLFWTLTLVHLIFIDSSQLKVIVMVPYLLAFSLLAPGLLDPHPGALDGARVLIVIVGNFFAPLRFILDVLFVAFILAEFYEETSKARNEERVRVLFITSLILILVLFNFSGVPGDGFDNKLLFYMNYIVLGIIGATGFVLPFPLKEKIATLAFVFYVRLSHFL